MKKLEVTTNQELDQIRQAIADGQSPYSLAANIADLTFSAALELAFARWSWQNADNIQGLQFFEKVSSHFRLVGSVADAIVNGRAPEKPHGFTFAPFPCDFCTVQNKSDITDTEFSLFLMRFSKALESARFGRDLSRAIAIALGEMADNVIQHSRQPASVHGIVAYEVKERDMTFVVGDVGEGVLKSLNRSPKWQSLNSSKEALYKAICQGATSREDAQEGQGFNQVHRALATYNGILRFRSGDAVLTISGASEPKAVVIKRTAPMEGFQVCVSCQL